MGTHGAPMRTHGAPIGGTWGPMGTHGAHGNPWEPMGTHGNAWGPWPMVVGVAPPRIFARVLISAAAPGWKAGNHSLGRGWSPGHPLRGPLTKRDSMGSAPPNSQNSPLEPGGAELV